MADVRPFAALRFAPRIDLAQTVCPPFDTISPDEQRRLYRRSDQNAIRLELPERKGDPYKSAAKTLRKWVKIGTLIGDDRPSFYVYQQQFEHRGESYQRRLLFVRLRLEPWDAGVVLPHERTFRAPKEDRLNLLRSLRLNTSPIFMVYPDARQLVAPLVARCASLPPAAQFTEEDSFGHSLWRIDDAHVIAAIRRAFESGKLYVADGHHRYETALAYRDEQVAASNSSGAGDGPEEFVLAALAVVDDPGLLVLPIHRLVNVEMPLEQALDALRPLFEVETRPSLTDLLRAMAERGRTVNSFGFVAAGSPEFYMLTLSDPGSADPYLPGDRSPAWRRLDAAVAAHVILRHVLGLNDYQMEDLGTVWYDADADSTVANVRAGKARYGVLLNPISPRQVLAVADAGERMPQKSTFFYPKIPTGLLFNPLDGA